MMKFAGHVNRHVCPSRRYPASLSYFLSLTLPHRSLSRSSTYNLKGIHLVGRVIISPLILNLVCFFLSLFLQCCSSLTLVDSDDGDGHLHFWCWFTQFNPLSVAIGKTSAASLCVCVWGEWEREKRGGGKCCLLNITCDSRDAHWTIRRVSGHLAYPPKPWLSGQGHVTWSCETDLRGRFCSTGNHWCEWSGCDRHFGLFWSVWCACTVL